MSQHSLNIVNQSGASFRSDLNNALAALKSGQSGTTRPSGATAGQMWIDTSAASPNWLLKVYDGSQDLVIAIIDPAGHTVKTLNALYTGSTNPAQLQANSLWLKTTVTPNELYLYNGFANLKIGVIGAGFNSYQLLASDLSQSAGQAIAASTVTALSWSSQAVTHTTDFWSGTNPTRILIPAGVVRMRFTLHAGFTTTFTNSVTLSIFGDNGVSRCNMVGTGSADMLMVSPWLTTAGVAYFEAKILQTSAASKTTGLSTTRMTVEGVLQ